MKPEWALAMVVITAVLLVGALRGMRLWLLPRVGPQGYFLLWGFSAAYLVPALCWLMGLNRPLNDPNNPILLGTGGYYGLNSDYFPEAILLSIFPPILACILTLIFSPQKHLYQTPAYLFQKISRQLRIARIGYIALFCAVLLTTWYFSLVGWERFWESSLDRFEFSNASQGDFSGKIVVTFILAFGCLGAALAFFRGLFWISSLTVLMASLPFCAFASRGVTVLVTAYSVAVLARTGSRYRWLVLLPLLFCVYVSLRLPLVMRTSGQSGLKIAALSIYQTHTSGTELTDALTGSMLNIGQGFGLLVEERESNATGGSIIQGIPATYFLLSVSPSVSFIDSFATKWLEYHPRQNLYTPYSGLCELVAIHPSVGVAFPVCCYFLAVWVCRRFSGGSLWRDIGLLAFVLIVTLGFLQLQQYPLRTGTRFFYAGAALLGLFLGLEFLAKTSYAGQQMRKGLRLFVRNSALSASDSAERLGPN